MDPIPAPVAAAIATAMVSAVLALWRSHINERKRCEDRGEKLESEVVATKALVIDLYRENAKNAEVRAAESARREVQMAETARVCARVLKRYETTPIPDESSGETTAVHRIHG